MGVLSGNKIGAIENLGVTEVGYNDRPSGLASQVGYLWHAC